MTLSIQFGDKMAAKIFDAMISLKLSFGHLPPEWPGIGSFYWLPIDISQNSALQSISKIKILMFFNYLPGKNYIKMCEVLVIDFLCYLSRDSYLTNNAYLHHALNHYEICELISFLASAHLNDSQPQFTIWEYHVTQRDSFNYCQRTP